MQISKKTFKEILKAVSPIIGNNTVIPILECIKIEAGYITATDLNTTVGVKFPFNPTMDPFEPICVPFKDFNALIDACGDVIDISTNGLNITVSSGRYTSTITGENAADFPASKCTCLLVFCQ